MLIVHPHLHRRRTGVTAHVEAVVRALGPGAAVVGWALADDLPRVTLAEVARRSRTEPVVWHAHRNVEVLLGLVLRLLGVKVRLVATRHSGHAPSWPTRWLLGRADAVVALTPDAPLPGPHHVVGHGVDVARFAPTSSREAACRALGLPGARAIGVVGRVRPSKGQGDFVEALAPLLPSYSAWTPVLVGLAKGEDAAWAEGLRAKAGGRLMLAGEQRDVAGWYRGLTVAVQPSHAECFSLVLLEAMASGCCVIASRLPHVAEVIEHERTGLLYPPGDVEALRALLQRVLAAPELAERLGQAAREEVLRRFTVQREAEALRAVYEAA